jgi:hypothetical protein
MIASFAADQHFCEYYKRNNKGKGRKNLRCFPDCRTTGHVATGYCGRPVIVDISYDCAAAKDLDLMAFCEVRTSNVSHAPTSGVSLGKNYAFSEILEQSRGTGHNPGEKALHPWFPGFVLKSHIDPTSSRVSTTFSFNYRNQGWHYAWQAQSRQNTKHELHVFILAGSKHSAYFTCVCELTSPTFDVHCRRKVTMVQENAKMEAQEALDSLSTSNTPLKRPASELSSPSVVSGRFVAPERYLPGQLMAVNYESPTNEPSASPKRARPTETTRMNLTNPGVMINNTHQRITELEARKTALEMLQSYFSTETRLSSSTAIAPTSPGSMAQHPNDDSSVEAIVACLSESGAMATQSGESLVRSIQQLRRSKEKLQVLNSVRSVDSQVLRNQLKKSPIGRDVSGPAPVKKPPDALSLLALCC